MVEGEKIYLVPITKEHTDLIVKWRNKESVRRNFIYQEDFTSEGHNSWIDNQVNVGKVAQFIIFDKSDNCPVGTVFLRDIDKINNKAEYGIFIGEDSARGKGLGTEAASLMCDYGINDLKLHKIILRAFADNTFAIKSYENAGFVKEAYLKDEVFINGNYRDIVLMAVFEN